MKNSPALLLLPNLLGDTAPALVLPPSIAEAVANLDGLIAESAGGGRRYLGRFPTKRPPHLIPIALLNEHTPKKDMDFLLEPILKGERWGLVSDAGLPCIADPGAQLVYRARQLGIAVEAFAGPSSIVMALMLSGFSGQQFTFHGYLERDALKLKGQLQQLEHDAKHTKYTQIWMEAPYRSDVMLENILQALSPNTLLSVAWDLTLPTQGVVTQPVHQWKQYLRPELNKKNVVFLIGAP